MRTSVCVCKFECGCEKLGRSYFSGAPQANRVYNIRAQDGVIRSFVEVETASESCTNFPLDLNIIRIHSTLRIGKKYKIYRFEMKPEKKQIFFHPNRIVRRPKQYKNCINYRLFRIICGCSAFRFFPLSLFTFHSVRF